METETGRENVIPAEKVRKFATEDILFADPTERIPGMSVRGGAAAPGGGGVQVGQH